jgi:hypothetical protein
MQIVDRIQLKLNNKESIETELKIAQDVARSLVISISEKHKN